MTSISELKRNSYMDYTNATSLENSQFRTINGFKVYFSYRTVVAFEEFFERFVVQNQWGRTTGKHLNAIDGGDRGSRFAPDDFYNMLLNRVGIDGCGRPVYIVASPEVVSEECS